MLAAVMLEGMCVNVFRPTAAAQELSARWR
jgi:hypothetical protein